MTKENIQDQDRVGKGEIHSWVGDRSITHVPKLEASNFDKRTNV